MVGGLLNLEKAAGLYKTIKLSFGCIFNGHRPVLKIFDAREALPQSGIKILSPVRAIP